MNKLLGIIGLGGFYFVWADLAMRTGGAGGIAWVIVCFCAWLLSSKMILDM